MGTMNMLQVWALLGQINHNTVIGSCSGGSGIFYSEIAHEKKGKTSKIPSLYAVLVGGLIGRPDEVDSYMGFFKW